MAKNLQEQINRLTVKADLLLSRYRSVLTAREEAEVQISALSQKIAEKDAIIKALTRQLHVMKMSTALSPDYETLEDTRQAISNLINDIDRCIADLEN